ncbi:MAG TPA: class I SAM-dependent methyltransferase [Candidatus Methylacidiphilales bacterium]
MEPAPIPPEVAPRKFILPQISVSEILDGRHPIKTLEPDHSNGNVSLLELLVLNTLVARISPKKLFEIGTFEGRTTLNITANAAPNAQTFTLDLPSTELANTSYTLDPHDVQFADKEASGRRFNNTPWKKQITQLLGDSAKFDFQPFWGQNDFVFIDGSHAYEYVKSDTTIALQLVTPSSFIVWHDYQPFWTGVVDYLEELYLSGGVFSQLRHIESTTLVVLPIGTSI